MKRSRRIIIKEGIKKINFLISKVKCIISMIWILCILLLKYVLIYAYLIIVCCGGILILESNFLDKSADTTLFTSIGFGFFAVTANICFSWCKTFPSEQNKMANNISFYGERLFLSALCFVIASLCKRPVSVPYFRSVSE